MKIVVCVKAVPSCLAEPGLPDAQVLALNPYDTFALKKLVERIRPHEDTITCLCMGPPHARAALERCLALGAAEAILLSDSRFSGSDTFATAIVLSAALQRIDFDVVVCGHEAVDGETGQVPYETAVRLGLTCIGEVIDFQFSGHTILIDRQERNIVNTIQAHPPFMICCRELCLQTNVSLMARKRAKGKEIPVWNADHLSMDLSLCGQEGSRTKVIRSTQKSITRVKEPQYFQESPEKAAEFLLNQCREHVK
ncbi:MAG: hypothetical protein HFJ79_02230 [Clostridiales bacterium]|nr:hypothetical protein [Clostridiales bacterium]